jgi:acetyl-CoA carboxylase carboxyltransferase component
MKNDEEALLKIKSIIAKFGHRPTAGFNRIESVAPKLSSEKFLEIFPDSRVKPYQTYDLIDFLIDEGSWDEYKKDYGKTIVTGYARIDGWAVGIVANQRAVVKNKKGEMQFGGVIYSDSADKAARFIMNCNQKRIPLVFLQDVTGFMVGSRSEHGGIIKDGAKMVNTVANSVVPKFTIIVGNSYGAGNYAMCGKAYDPRFIFAWPTAQIAVMGGSQAANTLLQIQTAAQKKAGKDITPDEEKKLLDEIIQKYESTTNPYYAAARLWVDDIILPENTRKMISLGIEAANHNPNIPEFKLGVIQT